MKKFIFRFKEFSFKENLDERGSILVIIAITMVVLLGMTALVTDVGAMALNRNRLQAAADSAALAGAQELPFNTALARSVAEDYLKKNLNDSYNPIISFSESNQKITVEITRNIEFSFARVLGINDNDVKVSAAAINAPARSVVSGLRPFGIVWNPALDFKSGEEVILKYIPNIKQEDELGPGNFGSVNLWGKDPHYKYSENILYGTKNHYAIGDGVDTFPGNNAGPTAKSIRDLLDENGGSVTIMVPLFSTMDVSGNKEIIITGFAAFRVEDVEEKGNNVDVRGRFVEHVTLGNADLGGSYHGVRAVNLVE